MAKERIWNKSLDIIKTVAIITVLMTHISASFVILFPVSSPEFIWGKYHRLFVPNRRATVRDGQRCIVFG